MNGKIAVLFVLLMGCPFVGQAEDRNALNQGETMRARMGDQKDQTRFHQMINESSDAYAAIAKGPHGEVPARILKNAQCIAVLPNVVTGALVVGGSHGKGLASCKDSNNAWSQPAAISLNQGSIGLQVGAKSADLVLFFQNNKAVQALKQGDLSIGGDVSAVAGNFDSSVDTSNAGVVVYSRAQGAYAGASITGSKISKNQEDLESYYSRKVDYVALLERRESPDTTSYTDNLTKLFP